MEESMKDFEAEIDASFRKFRQGDIVRATVVDVSEEEILVDLNTYSGGVIPAREYSDDPSFKVMDEIRVGSTIEAMVMEDGDQAGRVELSLKEARKQEGWQALSQAMTDKRVYEVKAKEAVNAGAIAYAEGIRGFIPASMLALDYVENPEEFVGKTLRVHVMEVNEEDNKLILSAKDVAKEEAAKVHEQKLNALQKGFITEGVIERIENYGCFVRFGEDLTGLVHISQICNKFLHSPNEVVKLGQKVKVKVLDINEGKIRLSIKEAEDIAPEMAEEAESAELEYNDEEQATTSLGSLLAGIKLD